MCQGGKSDAGKTDSSFIGMNVCCPSIPLGDISGIEGQNDKDMCQGTGNLSYTHLLLI